MENNYRIPLRHYLCQDLSFTDEYQMPRIKPYIGEIPSEIMSFNRARALKQNPSIGVHFYVQDSFFNCVWNSPTKYVEMFKRFWGIISTDYSVYAEMTISEVMWNSFRNKLLAAWYQKQGVIVIPNVSWSRPWSYGFCFDGFPKNSIIAINSTGIGNDSFSIKLWIEGYQRALEVLEPVKIIRYGAKMAGENEAISIYFPNDNYKSASYGR